MNEVNVFNAKRQLRVNYIAKSIGTGTGTAAHDGVPGTRISHANGYHGTGYGGYHAHGAGYGNINYGSTVYGYQANRGFGQASHGYGGYGGHGNKGHGGYWYGGNQGYTPFGSGGLYSGY